MSKQSACLQCQKKLNVAFLWQLHKYIGNSLYALKIQVGLGHLQAHAMHTVSFDWFLSGLEWIIYLEFCYIKILYFTRNYYRISDLGLTLPHFEFLSLYLDMFDQNWSFLHKIWRFWSNISKYRLENSKCGKVKPRSDIL